MVPKHLRLCVGHSQDPEFRRKGSSGGVATSVLAFLLRTHEVDAVIGVGYDDPSPVVPVYRIIHDPSQITELSGSKYVYMELPPLLDLIQRHRHLRLAVVAQPCFIPALRAKCPDLAFLISFFCGYNMEFAATEYFIRKSGLPPQTIAKIDYRGGDYPGGFSIRTSSGETKAFGKENYELANLMFLRDGCNACRLYIAAQADIVLGDAWIRNVKKTSVILTVTDRGDDVLRRMHKSRAIALYHLDEKQLERMHGHNLKDKTRGRSAAMRFLIRHLRDPRAPSIMPFHLMGFMSKIRRHFCIGINMQLKEIGSYDEK